MEFAFIAPVLLTLTLAAFDFGYACLQYIRLGQVVQNSGQYAISHPNDTTEIVTIASDAATDAGLSLITPKGQTDAVKVTYVCSCPGSSATPWPIDCTNPNSNPASCSTTDQSVRIEAQAGLTFFLFDAANLPPTTIDAVYVARIQ